MSTLRLLASLAGALARLAWCLLRIVALPPRVAFVGRDGRPLGTYRLPRRRALAMARETWSRALSGLTVTISIGGA